MVDAFLSITGKRAEELSGADIGAGTGIWTRALATRGVAMTAVEPNDAMRREGHQQNDTLAISWRKGSAEDTGLPASGYDVVCMASSFHWANYDSAVTEFARILKPGGLFIAVWNTRHYITNPLLIDIENKLYALKPDMKRKSSGRSEFCEQLLERLKATDVFEDALYMEGRHTEQQTPEAYIGLWQSVNDVQVQLGSTLFSDFIEYIRKATVGIPYIDAEYVTRAWIARRA